jgi:hypothetical protein
MSAILNRRYFQYLLQSAFAAFGKADAPKNVMIMDNFYRAEKTGFFFPSKIKRENDLQGINKRPAGHHAHQPALVGNRYRADIFL